MTHLEQHASNVMRPITSYLLDALADAAEDPDALIKSFWRDLTGERQSAPFWAKDRAGRYLLRLFQGHQEIAASIRCLEKIPKYARTNPHKDVEVSLGDHLRYHYENYWQEIYVLHERLKSHPMKLARCFKGNDPHRETMDRASATLRLFVQTALGRLITIRGGHVHKKRLPDIDLKRLTTLETMMEIGIDATTIYEPALERARESKVSLMLDANERLRPLIDEYFSVINAAVFNDSGNIIFPGGVDAMTGR